MAKEPLKDVKEVEAPGSKAEAQAPKKEQAAVQKAVYSVSELAVHAEKLFAAKQEVVKAALKAAGKLEYTVYEAKEIVEKFKKREVK